jgi:hypothetical protein
MQQYIKQIIKVTSLKFQIQFSDENFEYLPVSFVITPVKTGVISPVTLLLWLSPAMAYSRY